MSDKYRRPSLVAAHYARRLNRAFDLCPFIITFSQMTSHMSIINVHTVFIVRWTWFVVPPTVCVVHLTGLENTKVELIYDDPERPRRSCDNEDCPDQGENQGSEQQISSSWT